MPTTRSGFAAITASALPWPGSSTLIFASFAASSPVKALKKSGAAVPTIRSATPSRSRTAAAPPSMVTTRCGDAGNPGGSGQCGVPLDFVELGGVSAGRLGSALPQADSPNSTTATKAVLRGACTEALLALADVSENSGRPKGGVQFPAA